MALYLDKYKATLYVDPESRYKVALYLDKYKATLYVDPESRYKAALYLDTPQKPAKFIFGGKSETREFEAWKRSGLVFWA